MNVPPVAEAKRRQEQGAADVSTGSLTNDLSNADMHETSGRQQDEASNEAWGNENAHGAGHSSNSMLPVGIYTAVHHCHKPEASTINCCIAANLILQVRMRCKLLSRRNTEQLCHTPEPEITAQYILMSGMVHGVSDAHFTTL